MTTLLQKHNEWAAQDAAEIRARSYQSPVPGFDKEFLLLMNRAAASLQDGHLRGALNLFQEASRVATAAETKVSRVSRPLLSLLVRSWGIGAAFYALVEGFLQRRLEPAEFGVAQFLEARRFAYEIGLVDIAEEITRFVTDSESSDLSPHQLSTDEQHAFDELGMAIRLLAIDDPFEGQEALSQEMNKVWPREISAVDAIRELRE